MQTLHERDSFFKIDLFSSANPQLRAHDLRAEDLESQNRRAPQLEMRMKHPQDRA